MLKRKTRDCEENEVEKESGKSTVSKCSDLSLFLLLLPPPPIVWCLLHRCVVRFFLKKGMCTLRDGREFRSSKPVGDGGGGGGGLLFRFTRREVKTQKR